MYTVTLRLSFLACACTLLLCCKKKVADQPVTTSSLTDSSLSYPSYFPPPVYDFRKNPFSPQKAYLGKMLFYDAILSKDSSISCASCHQPFSAFSHLKHDLSHGIQGKLGLRNAPGLFNLAWAPNFMWDGAIPNIEVMPVAPISNPVEMGESMANVLSKLNRHPVYKAKFKDAFGVDEIQSVHMLKAIAQFLVSIVSSNSKYDKYLQGKATLTDNELKGLAIVRQKCQSCHAGELFTDFKMRNIGLDTTEWITSEKDPGMQAFTGLASDRRKFRTPSLRNFAITFPYLHDGRSWDLKGVLDRHDSLVQDNPNLDPLIKTNGKIGIKLSTDEFAAIDQFLKTLTDASLATNPAYITPFDKYTPSDGH